jgi:formylglycine-generating enzyme required for sulfatase activity
LFVVPPAVFAARLLFMPQFGWYKNYNKPGANLSHFEENFWSFFDNVVPYHFKATGGWIALHPVITVILVAGVAVWIWKAPRSWSMQCSRLRTYHLFWFGGLTLFLAVFPLAAGGKTFDPVPVGETSRHCMLATLPLAILVFATIRFFAFMQRRRNCHWMAPVVAALCVIFGGQYLGIYTKERAEWVFSRSVLHNAASSPEIRECSVILLEDVSVAQQIIYGTYGFATKFGERTRLVIAKVFPPANQKFYFPSEIERYASMTTAVMNEFRQIDPAGQQVFIKPERLRGGADDWNLVCRYLRLRYFGSEAEMNEMLADLTRLNVYVLKPPTPMTPGAPRSELDPSRAAREVTKSGFTNGIGMPLVYLPYGWWAAQFETTQAQYEAVIGRNPSFFNDPVRPVECVTWEEANEFCRRLNETEAAAGRLPSGFVYRLPTVEEFEKLTPGSSYEQAVTAYRQVLWSTAPVGSQPPNALKLHDVFGNVWEWCLDWSDEPGRYKRYEGGSWVNAQVDLTRFTEPPGKLSWYGNAILDQTYGPHRRDHPDQGFWNRGFRCLLAPPVADPDRLRQPPLK